MEYLVAGKEVGASGTPHFQVYLETKTKRFVVPLAKKLAAAWGCGQPHVEIAHGSVEQNKTYCSKDGIFLEFGTPMKQGARTDLSSVIADIASGSSMKQLWEEHPEIMIKYSTGIKQCYQNTSPNLKCGPLKTFSLEEYPHWNTEEIQATLGVKAVILWGESGLGKTCYARALLPNALFVCHMDDLHQFDKATHDGIIFDDFSIKHLHREAQIHLLDTDNPRSIHCRYQTANIPAGTKKIFTTNERHGIIYSADDMAIERRLRTFQCRAPEDIAVEIAGAAIPNHGPEGQGEVPWDNSDWWAH